MIKILLTKSFRDKYLALILVLLTGAAFGQVDTTKQRQRINAYGYDYKNVAFDSSLRVPQDTFKLKSKDSGSIAFKNGCLYVWMRGSWAQINCPSATPPPVGSPLAIITNPASQTITEGAGVTFTVAATGGSTPYTYQWQKDAVNVSGATASSYTFTTTSGSAGSYRAIVTDAASASVTSNAATLTINTPITVSWGYYTTDPYPALSTGSDALTYNGTFNITNNADISIPYPSAANDKYWVAKVPIGQSLKVNWFNTSFNFGTIPDAVWQSPLTIGSFRYYVTRITASLDPASPVILQD